ncbi:MAG TPA: ABC transporter ATP-binding protein [Clostridia bacterium]|nr:ABC transporter ATP-binding protein [Clostridia bacterium]
MRKNFKKLAAFFRLSWQVSPSYIFLVALNTAVGFLQMLSNVLLPKYLVDELMGAKDISMLLLWGGLIVGANVFFAFLNNILKRFMSVKNELVNDKMQEALGKKIMNVEFSHLETPYYLDLKERAAFVLVNQGVLPTLVDTAANTVKNVFTVAGLLAVLLTFSPLLVMFLVITIVLTLLVNASFSKYQTKFFQELIPVNRRYGYYFGLGFDEKLQKDVRLYDMSEMMVHSVEKENDTINAWFSTFWRKLGGIQGLYGVINDLQAAIVYGYTGLRAFSNAFGPQISLGSFTMYISAAISFTAAVTQTGGQFVRLWQNLTYLEPFMELMALPDESEQKGDPFPETVGSIEFRDVSFRYPGSETLVLDGISFKIGQGEKISVVGLNGAGKTTLVKLLCRLYKPTSGSILINGRDIFSYDNESYRARIAAVFQDYRLFDFTIEENVTCGEAGADTARAMGLLDEVGLKGKVESLPNGIRSLFGKSYDPEGIEMSGGQNQKVAIARALYKDASLIILDEPTSALDPLAEAEIYEHFNALVGDKTALYISHRMSSSVFCDRVLVIENGAVRDFDTHFNLMKKTDSLYYKLFMAQAENYRTEAAAV